VGGGRVDLDGMNTRRRILVFAPHFAEISVRLAQALAVDHDVLLVIDGRALRRDVEAAWFKDATRGLKVLEFRADRRYWRLLWPPILMLAARLFQPDVVHMQEQADVTSAVMAGFFSRRFPLVVTVHDPAPHAGNDAEFLRQGAQPFRDEIRSQAHAFHVHSGFALGEMQALYGDRPIIQTEHGEIHVPAPAERRAPEAGRILFFGRMEAYKGLGVLLGAMDRLRASGRDYTLVIAGRGDELDRLSPRARAMPGVRIIDRFLSPQDVIAEFQAAAVIVLPYVEATQSGVAAAAFANDRPVVASNTGGLPEIVEAEVNGLLVSPGDADDLADALDRVLGEEGLHAKLAAGAHATQALIGWDAVAALLTGAYQTLLQAAPRENSRR
jgi:glycosyltransferase involved in cell wall biosynthesis